MSDTAPVKIMTREDALHASVGLAPGEQFVVRWQLSALGDFRTKLAELICAADEQNRARLRLAFPEEVAAIQAWLEGDMAVRLREIGMDL